MNCFCKNVTETFLLKGTMKNLYMFIKSEYYIDSLIQIVLNYFHYMRQKSLFVFALLSHTVRSNGNVRT